MKPKLTPEQKMVLIQELLEWAFGNNDIMAADSPQLHVFKLIESIQIDKATKTRANNNHVIIKQLKQNGILWMKLVPFLENENADCKTKTGTKEESLYDTCHHGPDEHDADGKCTGSYTIYDKQNHWKRTGEKKCPCQHYKTNQTW